MFLQSYVFPIVVYSVEGGSARLIEILGTAFAVGSRGVFLTARHVIECAQMKAASRDLRYGLVVKGRDGASPESVVATPLFVEFAKEPFDVAIGRLPYRFDSLLALKAVDVVMWQNVAALGYPLCAVSGDPSGMQINIRGHRGYVQRLLAPGDMPVGRAPAGFELSFLLGRGVSGGPLFIRAEPRDIVIGVCVGSMRSEIVEDERLDVMENGRMYREIRMKVEEFGVAHDIRPLHSWKPDGLLGRSLIEESHFPGLT